MPVVFRIAYSLAVAILYILFVVFGVRTLYSEPDYPGYPAGPKPTDGMIYCERSDECYRETYDPADGVPRRELITPEIEETLTAAERNYLQSQREYENDIRDYEHDREVYFRNVFIIAAFFGVLAIIGAVLLYRRVDAMPLGLLLGGIGSLIYGWVEWARGPDEAGTSVVFVIITGGLLLVLAGGYWFLGGREGKRDGASGSGSG